MKRLLVLCLLTIALLAAAIYQTDSITRARALTHAQRDLAARAHFLADVLDRMLQLRMTQVFTFAALPSMRGFAASDDAARVRRAAVALAELHAIVAADPNVRAASIADPTGIVILTTDGSMYADWSARVFMREALGGQLHASVPARDFGEISQFYSAPILDNAGNVAGALVVRVAAQEMWGVLSAQKNVLLVDEKGVRIADRSDKPQTFVALVPLAPNVAARVAAEQRYGAEMTQIRATNLPELVNAIPRASTMQLTFRDTSGQTVHAATRRLATNPWTVVAFETADAIAAAARETLWDTLIIAAVAFVVAAALFYVAARRTTAEFVLRRLEKED